MFFFRGMNRHLQKDVHFKMGFVKTAMSNVATKDASKTTDMIIEVYLFNCTFLDHVEMKVTVPS